MSTSKTVTRNDLKAVLEALPMGAWESSSTYCKMPDGTLMHWISSSISDGQWQTVIDFHNLPFVDTNYVAQVTWVMNDADIHNVAALTKTTTSITVTRIRGGGVANFELLLVGRWK